MAFHLKMKGLVGSDVFYALYFTNFCLFSMKLLLPLRFNKIVNCTYFSRKVRLLMLPNKKQKHKTKIRSGENPQYVESFLLHRVNPEEVNSMGLRIRLYGCERMRKERLIGEAYVSFATIDLELETNLWLPLEPRNTSSVSYASVH